MRVTSSALAVTFVAAATTVAYQHAEYIRVLACEAEVLCRFTIVPHLTILREYIHSRVHTGPWISRWNAAIGALVYRRAADAYARWAIEEGRLHYQEDDGFTHQEGEAALPTVFGPALGEMPEDTRRGVRRGGRRNACLTVYHRCVAELGKKPFSPAMKLVVEDVARKELKKLNVRVQDFPTLLAGVVAVYFTPTEEEVETAAILRNAQVRDLWAEIEVPK